MPIIEFGKDDLNRDTVFPPSWYEVQVTSITEGLSKAGDSTNFPVQALIIRNADTGSTEFEGYPIGGLGCWFFNTKVKSFISSFLKAIGVSPEEGKRYDLAMAAGEKLEVFIENDQYQGRTVNRVQHKYRPVGGGK